LIELVLGPFLGVVGGLASKGLYDYFKDAGNKKKLKENLKNELENCLELLTEKGNLLPIMMWNSTVTSGDVKLLSFDERNKLSKIYFEIDNYNYEAKRVRDSAVVASTGDYRVTLDGRPEAKAYWHQLSKALIKEEGILKAKISVILEDGLWNK
jgi:hypothetical protein